MNRKDKAPVQQNPAGNQPAPIEAEEESAMAQDEPMGSIAAAVPGSNKAAQDVKRGKLPGAESPQMRDVPETTAGTEFKRKGEEPAA